MPADWYDTWAEHHAAIFRLNSEADVKMFNSWREIFLAARYTPDELHAATLWIAQNNPPRFASEHLAALTAAIRKARAVDYAPSPAPEQGTCTLCGGSGLVVVPHLAGIRQGEWDPVTAGCGPTYYTCSVLCRCPLGWWMGTRRGASTSEPWPRPAQMTLDDYERKNPDWREHLAERRRELAARAKLGPAPSPKFAAALAGLLPNAPRIHQPLTQE